MKVRSSAMGSTHIPKEGRVPAGLLFNEPMPVEDVRPGGGVGRMVGLGGSRTDQFRRGLLSEVDPGLLRTVEVLDRVHAAMPPQTGGRANALTAPYPRESEEGRLPDALLLAAP